MSAHLLAHVIGKYLEKLDTDIDCDDENEHVVTVNPYRIECGFKVVSDKGKDKIDTIAVCVQNEKRTIAAYLFDCNTYLYKLLHDDGSLTANQVEKIDLALNH